MVPGDKISVDHWGIIETVFKDAKVFEGRTRNAQIPTMSVNCVSGVFCASEWAGHTFCQFCVDLLQMLLCSKHRGPFFICEEVVVQLGLVEVDFIVSDEGATRRDSLEQRTNYEDVSPKLVDSDKRVEVIVEISEN